GFVLSIKPQIFFKKDKIRLLGLYEYKNTNDNYYGVGYETNHNTLRGRYTTGFTSNTVHLNPILMFQLRGSKSYLGPTIDYIYEKMTTPGEEIINDPVYIAQGGDSTGLKTNNLGVGIVFTYDTRDVAANAYHGILFEASLQYYSKYLGGDYNFGSLNIDYRQYIKLSKKHRRILAWNILAKSTFQDVPLSQYALIGNPYSLRGYYQGQYRDKSTIMALLEYRQMWDLGDQTKARRLFSRLGYAAWGGCGFMGPNPVCYNSVFPNIGLGLRVEVQPRMNFRFDAGYSFIDKQTLFYFNMTEAF
ncbi:MAG: BamA/TamA family outer membrane protein, partial [Bacteroidales bacterium]